MDARAEAVANVRQFNRFYTRAVGLLEETLSSSAYTLTEARVLFELGHHSHSAARHNGESGFLADAFALDGGPAASEIAAALRLDPAYLTRILRKFAADGLTEARHDETDRRRKLLSLTAKGRAVLAKLQSAADAEIGSLIRHVPDGRLAALTEGLRKVEALLDGRRDQRGDVTLRPHAVGDIGWVIERQSRLYAEEYGWNGEYEALVCEIGASFLRNFVPGKEFCWIAERAGERVGAVLLVRRSAEVGQLRMLHVEKSARGAGVGGMLVRACVETARDAGYRTLMLWTNDVLADARRLYEKSGFRLVSEEQHRSFGKELNGQNWELAL